MEALDRREYSRAETELSGLLADDSLSRRARAFLLNKRGVARIAMESRDLARDDFAAALGELPGYAPALTNLGNLLLDQGKLEAATAHYEEAIANDPQYAIAFLNLSVAYKRAGRFADAVRALRTSQRLEARRPTAVPRSL
ncbi:MAG: tetratricopeptide repeat protein [Candidatus Eremiobacteraeota bacterium]|nr:tetratricopeptide repeat protein [Candidatus Eremiobacteraeota bacterium]